MFLFFVATGLWYLIFGSRVSIPSFSNLIGYSLYDKSVSVAPHSSQGTLSDFLRVTVQRSRITYFINVS